MLLPDEVPKT